MSFDILAYFGDDNMRFYSIDACSHSNPVCKLSWANEIHRLPLQTMPLKVVYVQGVVVLLLGTFPQTTRLELAWYAVPYLTFHDLVPACNHLRCRVGLLSTAEDHKNFGCFFLKVLCRFWSLWAPYSIAWQHYRYDRSSLIIAAYDSYLQISNKHISYNIIYKVITVIACLFNSLCTVGSGFVGPLLDLHVFEPLPLAPWPFRVHVFHGWDLAPKCACAKVCAAAAGRKNRKKLQCVPHFIKITAAWQRNARGRVRLPAVHKYKYGLWMAMGYLHAKAS